MVMYNTVPTLTSAELLSYFCLTLYSLFNVFILYVCQCLYEMNRVCYDCTPGTLSITANEECSVEAYRLFEETGESLTVGRVLLIYFLLYVCVN
jgi:hypothetical protein